jgi:hypothetical protein
VIVKWVGSARFAVSCLNAWVLADVPSALQRGADAVDYGTHSQKIFRSFDRCYTDGSAHLPERSVEG